jgi:hypothetical protein
MKFLDNLTEAAAYAPSASFVIAVLIVKVHVLIAGLSLFLVALYNFPWYTAGTVLSLCFARIIYAGIKGK